MYPKVSLLWVNYNSSEFKNVIKESISSIEKLNYPDFELIVIDGCSTDDSPDYVLGLLKKSKLKYKFIKQKKNLGLHSSWNVGYEALSSRTKYLMLVNNDVKLYPNSVKEFVSRMEKDPKIGALNGIEFRWNSKVVDHAGMMFDELFTTTPLSQGYEEKDCEKKEHVISVASSVLGMFRRSATDKLGKPLLEENMVRHFNETILGARIWNEGYKILYVPIKVGEHYTRMIKESRSFKRIYYATRGWLTLLFISNSPYKKSFLQDSYLAKQLLNRLMKGFDFKNYKEAISYYREVSKDAEQKAAGLMKRKIKIDLYKIPHIKGFRYYWVFPRTVTKMVQPNKKFTELMKSKSVYIPEGV